MLDYNNMTIVRGGGPKIVWLQIGNCTTAEVETVFRNRFSDIEAFENDASAATLVLS